jgi:hypothetical protein
MAFDLALTKCLEQTDRYKQRHTRECQALFDLFASTFPIYAPSAEVFAIVAQEAIPILSQS